MNNQTALADIQQKYAGCNLLMPASTEVQLNPFYKITVMEVTVDTSESSGDIFKVGSVKSNDDKGNDIWIPTYSLAKPLLMKFAAAAGIQFDPNHTYGTRVDQNTYKAKAYGAMRMPDGTGKTHADEKVICLDDEEANLRLEFMDKSIKGIVDEKAAKAAAEMFKGNWINTKNKWGKACKAYVIDDSDREKYIERSVLVNMTLLRKSAAEKAMTGAINRVIRALTGLKGQYTLEELQKPFAIPKVTFSPDYTDPEVRSAMISQGMNSIGSLFGAPALTAQIPVDGFIQQDGLFNPEEYVDNPAFDRDIIDERTDQSEEPEQVNPLPQEEQKIQPEQEVQQQAQPVQQASPYHCDNCGSDISEKIYNYSWKNFNRPLCIKCQKGAR